MLCGKRREHAGNKVTYSLKFLEEKIGT